MVSTTEVCTDNILMTPNPSVSTKNIRARKSLQQFTETLNVKNKTAVCRFGASKENIMAIKKFNVLWSNIAKRHDKTKNKSKVQRSPLPLDSKSLSGCAIFN